MLLKKTDSQLITPMSRLFNLQDVHIELSSKCTLKCPRCPRTELKPEELNKEFSLEDFQRAFPVDVLSKIRKMLFCGDIGDPIYATEFIPIIAYIKSQSNISVDIVTNGSYKKPEWWDELGAHLTKYDTVVFSVDGWDHDSNNLYRVNSDWNSIIAGIKSLRASSDCRIKWSSIYFNFNEDRMNSIAQLAKELGCDEWQAVKSTKFGGRYVVNGVDGLMPADANNIASNVYQTLPIILNRPKPISIRHQLNTHPWAKCLNWKKELFINVEGLIFPCPWFNSGYQDNDFVEKYRDRLNIKHRSIVQVLDDPLWDEFITRIEVMPLKVCKIKCQDCHE